MSAMIAAVTEVDPQVGLQACRLVIRTRGRAACSARWSGCVLRTTVGSCAPNGRSVEACWYGGGQPACAADRALPSTCGLTAV